jgi:hypothetical protein
MPADVIQRVHLLARRQKANQGLVFTDRNAVPWDDGYADDEHVQLSIDLDDDESDELDSSYNVEDAVESSDDDESGTSNIIRQQ